MCEMYHHLSHDVRLVFILFNTWCFYVTEELAASIFRVNVLGLGADNKFLSNVTIPSCDQQSAVGTRSPDSHVS
jgi:hypothetical protein